MDRFLINNAHDVERGQYFTKESPSAFSPKQANTKYPLGTFEEISNRSNYCRFCELVTRSVGTGEETVWTEEQQRATCYVTWEIDGRSAGNSHERVKARTRRLHLQWENGMLEDAYLVLVTQNRYNLINSDARHMWQEDSHFLARKVSSEASRETLVKSWLDDCLNNHGRDCWHSAREKAAFQEVTDQSYFGVIDVEQMCLTTLPRHPVKRFDSDDDDDDDRYSDASDPGEMGQETHDPYVALSYVWGGKNAEKTVHSNVLTRLLHGGLEEPFKKMPKVIQDTVKLVRRLGYRYLWIDAICIVQNSARSWKLNAEIMNMIYRNADLTICAADGVDATTGLKALSKPTHSQIIVECAPGLRLMVCRLAEASIKKSKWNTRGWTFQERLLSRRCLIFTEGRVMFQCRSAAMSEDIVTAPGSVDNASRWSLDLLQSPLQLLNSLAPRPIWFYMNCVQLYSARDLTKSGDILAAFNGVSNHIEDALSSPLTFGLPTSHFDLALLWIPLGSSQRRMGDESEDERFDDEPSRRRNSGHTRETNFPSWSWCGWQGCTMDYLTTSMIDDCLEDVNEWLTHHTWIQWHIRDGRGRLRPLWDSTSARQPRFSETRWRGYSSESDDLQVLSRRAPIAWKGRWQPTDILEERKAAEERKMYERKTEEERRMREMEAEEERRMREKKAAEERRIRELKEIKEIDRLKAAEERRMRELKEIERLRAEEERRMWELKKIKEMERLKKKQLETAARSTATSTARDQYGRAIGLHHHQDERMYFQRTIPESPYKVNMAQYTPDKDREYPDSPILQFWAHSAFLRLYPSEHKNKNGLVRFSITDASNDWCGTIQLSENWVEEEEERQKNEKLNWDSTQFEFLALSEAKKFTEEECGAWTYYLPLERKQSEWDLYFVLLTEKRNGTWSRVALGKVFSTAFENGLGGSSEWKEIVLV